MEFIKCTMRELAAVSDLYEKTLSHLEATVNYPKWTKEYPSIKSVGEAISRGEQYACTKNGEVLGAVVLNDDPRGDYGAGDWSRELKEGEYLVIHTLAVSPQASRRGIGAYMVDCAVIEARNAGYKAIRIDVVPDNTPAIALYMKKGFKFAGVKDLKRNIKEIPLFALYELNI
ncbi:MAG: GNAT family N-acetyltransferase [Clostridia bacterium]|nr:GNAT family N-acetyltransferase [Clostridia bacterium]